MRNNLLTGADFDAALELLPAVPNAQADRAAGAPLDTSGAPLSAARALTGRLLCNSLPDKAPFEYAGGFDGGTVVNYFGAFTDAKMFERFDVWRDMSKLESERSDDDYFVDLDGYRFQVLPYGSSGGVAFKYIFKYRSFTILITGKPDAGDRPTVQVDFSYESFREKTLFEVRYIVEDFLLYLGFRWDRVSFQRIDINVTVDADFQDVYKAFQEGRFISRLRIFRPVLENTSSGMTCHYIAGGSLKSSDVSICLYDKLHELSRQYNETKYDDLLAEVPNAEHLTRCEFRITSAFFRALGCNSFENPEPFAR